MGHQLLPVPPGYDAHRVRPIIESTLKKLGYSCPPTITAIGNLRLPLRQRPDVLPAISSTGILLQHVPSGFKYIVSELLKWRSKNPPPATLMLISSVSVENAFGLEYTILRAVPLQPSFLPTSYHHWVWESLLEDSESLLLQEKCSESGWVCTLCERDGQSIEDLTTHLKCRAHALREISKFIYSYPLPEEPSKASEEEEEDEWGTEKASRGRREQDPTQC